MCPATEELWVCEETKSSPVLSWKIPEVPGRVWVLPDPSGGEFSGFHGGLSQIHPMPQSMSYIRLRNGSSLSPQCSVNINCGCLFLLPLETECKGSSACGFKYWILNFRPVYDLCCSVMLRTWKVLCLRRKWSLFLFQLPNPCFHLDHVSPTKNLSKAKNFKNRCYERSESKEVPKRSVLIAHLFVSFNLLLQQRVNFHTHTKRSFVFPSTCEFCGILSGYRKAYLYFQSLTCQKQLLWKHPPRLWRVFH